MIEELRLEIEGFHNEHNIEAVADKINEIIQYLNALEEQFGNMADVLAEIPKDAEDWD